ncbi:MAG: enolase C-terminal domain-like protein [Mycobacterium sp.]
MKTWIDFDAAPVFAIPLIDAVGGRTVCEGMLIEGPQGWGEFSPPPGCDVRSAGRYLTAAIEVGTVGWPDPRRGRVPVAVSVPAVDPERAATIVADSGCRTAAVRVDGPLSDVLARLEAVRDALGPYGAIRCDVNGQWDIETAVSAIPALDRAAGGAEFVEQPCRTLEDVAVVRRRVGVRIAVDQSITEAAEPLRLPLAESADVAVLSVGALGGVRRALRVAESAAVPCVVAGELGSSIGIAVGLALAGVLPDTGFAATLGGARLLAGDVVSDARSLIPVDGHLPVAPMPPGPDPARLRQFPPTGAAMEARWRALLTAAQAFI